MPRLDIYKDHELTLQVEITEPEIRIGRGSDCPVSLPVPEVSRLHAVIRAVGRGWEVANHGRNGTRVNAARLEKPAPLIFGDRIYIDGYVVVFQADGAPPLAFHRKPGVVTVDLDRP